MHPGQIMPITSRTHLINSSNRVSVRISARLQECTHARVHQLRPVHLPVDPALSRKRGSLETFIGHEVVSRLSLGIVG